MSSPDIDKAESMGMGIEIEMGVRGPPLDRSARKWERTGDVDVS